MINPYFQKFCKCGGEITLAFNSKLLLFWRSKIKQAVPGMHVLMNARV